MYNVKRGRHKELLEARQQRLARSNVCESPIFKLSRFNFADVCNHAHYTLHDHAHFAGLIFGDSSLSAKISSQLHFLPIMIRTIQWEKNSIRTQLTYMKVIGTTYVADVYQGRSQDFR